MTKAAYGWLPLGFVPNAGQSDPSVQYLSRGPGYAVHLTRHGAVLVLTSPSPDGTRMVPLHLEFVGASANARVEARRQLAGRVHYLLGAEPAEWHTGLPTYEDVVYRDLWPGIDLVFRGGERRLKYEFVLQPAARVEAIRLAYRGADDVQLDDGGNLVIRTPLGVLSDERPVSYQEVDGRRMPVDSWFTRQDDGSYGFAVSGYDPRYPLTIDPGLGYATFLGGAGGDEGRAIAIDSAGNTYVTGKSTSGVNFPLPGASFDATHNGSGDAFVAKFDASGALVYATFLGGSGDDEGNGVAMRCPGQPGQCDIYVTGTTSSTNFPVLNPVQATNRGGADAFVTRLTPNGSALVYSTYLGSSQADTGTAIAVDGAGNAYVVGSAEASNFPTTKGRFQANNRGGTDAFVTKLTAAGALGYSTFLGGSANDIARGVAVDAAGNAHVTGSAFSTNFPITAGAFRTTLGDGGLYGDAFVTKLNAAGSALLYSTYLGGSGADVGRGIAIDPTGKIYVTGSTESANFPKTLGGFNGSGLADAFVAKLVPGGAPQLAYSVLLGGNGVDIAHAIAVDNAGNVFLTGQTDSGSAFPTTPEAFDGGTFDCNPGTDAFVASLAANGSGFYYAGCLGGALGTDVGRGIAVNKTFGTVHVAGTTSSTDFPTTTAFQPFFQGGSSDAFVAKLTASTVTDLTSSPNPSTFGGSVTFTATVTVPPPGLGTPTGTVTFMEGTTVLGTAGIGAGAALFSTSSLSAGSHPITATYSGDANFSDSADTLQQAVNPATTTTAISAPAITYNANGAVTVTVTSAAGTPTGNVSLAVDGGAAVFQALVNGSTTFILPSPSGGDHSLTATYPAMGNFDTSTATGTLHVNPAPTTTAISAPAITYNANGAVTVTVTSAAGTPTGQAALTVGNGAALTQTLAAGVATFTLTSPDAGNYALSAQFLGSQNFATSGPVAGNLHVDRAPTQTTLASSSASPKAGDSVTFTATVVTVSPGGGTPTGTVTFKDSGFAIGTGTLDGSGQATLTTSSLGVGVHAITAVYDQTTNFLASASTTLVQKVISNPVILSITSDRPDGGLSRNVVGQSVQIIGTGFLAPPGLGVGFGDPRITVVPDSVGLSTSVVAAEVTVAAEAVLGTRTVTVTNPDGASAQYPIQVFDPLPGQLLGLSGGKISNSLTTPPPTPTITTLTPNPGLIGSSVTIAGSNFGSTTSANTVRFAGAGGVAVAATVTSASATSLGVTVPASAADGPVTVTVSGVQSSGVNFTVKNPKLSGVNPFGAVQGSQNVTVDLYGTKFDLGGVTVAFGGSGISQVGPVTVLDSGHAQVLVNLATGAAVGFRDVTLTNSAGGASTLPQALEVKAPTRLELSIQAGGNVTSTYQPTVGNVTVTLDATGKCIAPYSVTPVSAIIQADFVGTGTPTGVTFTISATTASALAGTALNQDCGLDPVTGGTPTATPKDFSIGTFAGSIPAPTWTTSQAVTVSGAGPWQIRLYSWDQGGSVTITATASGTTATGTLRLPVDKDGDGVADVADPNPQNPNEPLLAGLTGAERYRGYYRQGPANGTGGLMGSHERLGSARHLFARPLGFAVTPADGTCGVNATDVRMPDTKPCPPFVPGGAFAEHNIEVHDVSGSFTAGAVFPQKSMADPTKPTLDMMTVRLRGDACKGSEPCEHTKKIGPRQWQLWTLGYSSLGTQNPTTGLHIYGAPTVHKKAIEGYFFDKPYKVQLNSPAGFPPAGCATPADGLPPGTCVGDGNDDGTVTLDPVTGQPLPGEVIGTDGKPAGPVYDPTSFTRDRSRMDINQDGCVELPLLDDPNAIPVEKRCNPATAGALLSAPDPTVQATLWQVVQLITTHEMIHACGALHVSDPTDVMNEISNNWNRAGHMALPTATQCTIHNKGLGK